MEIAAASPAPFVDFPDNITAPAIGTRRFLKYCVPLYDELAEMLDDENRPVFVHMDGDLRPLWQAIAESRVGGIDSLSPTPDNDTSIAEAVALWPEKRLWVNFPSSVHIRSTRALRLSATQSAPLESVAIPRGPAIGSPSIAGGSKARRHVPSAPKT